jgi:hypothetical protein
LIERKKKRSAVLTPQLLNREPGSQEFTLPVHLRYQLPSENSSAVAVVTAPNVYLLFSEEEEEEGWTTLCSPPQTFLVDIPVGNSRHALAISVLTALFTLLAALIILRTMIEQEKKKK